MTRSHGFCRGPDGHGRHVGGFRYYRRDHAGQRHHGHAAVSHHGGAVSGQRGADAGNRRGDGERRIIGRVGHHHHRHCHGVPVASLVVQGTAVLRRENSLSVWYLPVKSIGGAATEIDLGAVFRKGGSLMFGATWSLDSGSGLSMTCASSSRPTARLVVYQGTDPASSSTWALTGVYDIAPPLNKHAYFQAGGDLAILTDDGSSRFPRL